MEEHMKRARLLFLSVLLLSLCASAKDIVTRDGTTYKDVTVTQTTPIGISFISNGKGGWIDFRDMTDDEQKDYGYDRQKADEFEQKLVQNKGNMVPPDGAPDMTDIPADANLDPKAVPQTQDNTVVIQPNQQVPYDPSCFTSAGPVYTNQWVSWNGRYYPSYWWHQWYWNNHWAYHNGRYYPWHYYHNHGVWYHGKYYPYHHGLLAKNDYCQSKDRHGADGHETPRVDDLKTYTPHARPDEWNRYNERRGEEKRTGEGRSEDRKSEERRTEDRKNEEKRFEEKKRETDRRREEEHRPEERRSEGQRR